MTPSPEGLKMLTREKVIEIAEQFGKDPKTPYAHFSAFELQAFAAALLSSINAAADPLGWVWERQYSNGGYARKFCVTEFDARELAKDGISLPTPDLVYPFYDSPPQCHLTSSAAESNDRQIDAAGEAGQLRTFVRPHGSVAMLSVGDHQLISRVADALQYDGNPSLAAELREIITRKSKSQIEPAYLRLRKAAEEVCACATYHGEISGRDDRIVALTDALYETDDGEPGNPKSVYAALTPCHLCKESGTDVISCSHGDANDPR